MKFLVLSHDGEETRLQLSESTFVQITSEFPVLKFSGVSYVYDDTDEEEFVWYASANEHTINTDNPEATLESSL
jgi:hypothetical protein